MGDRAWSAAQTPDGDLADQIYTTEQVADAGGTALRLVDLDRDGRDEIIVGAPADSEGDSRAGKVYVLGPYDDAGN